MKLPMPPNPAVIARQFPVVMVLGGSGFIGRHAVEALRNRRAEVVIGSRDPLAIDERLPDNALRCPRRTIRFETMTVVDDWKLPLTGIDVVINCVGILRQRGRETYERVHHRAPAALAEACRQKSIRLIHVSALGLQADARSRFLRSKLAGEQALKASGADWCIVRPSLLDGDGGYGAQWLRWLARAPIHMLPADAIGKIAALDVRDLGEALAAIAIKKNGAGEELAARELELGGIDQRTLADYVAAIRRIHTARPARLWRIPGAIARIGSHICDLLHFSPFSYGHWELLRHDNCPRDNRLADLLGHPPRQIGVNVDSGIRNADAPVHAGNDQTSAVPLRG